MIKRLLAILFAFIAATAFAATDVNKANQAELEAVKGIGPAIAGKILDERKKSNFKDWSDLVERVKGVGDGNAAKFSTAGLTVNGQGFAGAAAPAAKAEAKPAKADKAAAKTDAPAEMPAARLRQMKTLASQFSSTMLGWKADKTDREPLRLLPQPLYRYDSKRSDVLDGAVFAFVQGTDPESLFLIEAFKKGDGFKWQFAFVRRTSGELEGRHKDNVVWHADRFPTNNDPRSTHRSLGRPLDLSVLSDLPKKGE